MYILVDFYEVTPKEGNSYINAELPELKKLKHDYSTFVDDDGYLTADFKYNRKIEDVDNNDIHLLLCKTENDIPDELNNVKDEILNYLNVNPNHFVIASNYEK